MSSEQSNDIAIKVEGLSKCYHIYDNPRDRLKQMILPRMARAVGMLPNQHFREFWALKDVSFVVEKGETVGIIGRNGSGKSTLLQLICGTLNLSSGSIQTNGRIAAMLELGSGFNPEFTGRENVYLNGALLGLNKDEIDERFNEITAFADIGDFIDQPVKTYSSGMAVRLAFAVQALSSPQILVVDEALAVGDAKFQAKCFAHIQRLKQSGTSILLVSHATEQIATHCDRAIFLNDGQVIATGPPRDIINIYLDCIFGAERATDHLASKLDVDELQISGSSLSTVEERFNRHQTYNPHEYRWGDGAARILDYALTGDGAVEQATIKLGAAASLRLSICFVTPVVRPILGFTIKTKEGVSLYNTNSELLGIKEISAAGAAGDVLGIVLNFRARFAPGDYFLSVGVASRRPDGILVPHDRRYDSIQMTIVSDGIPPFTGFFDIDSSMRTEFRHSALALESAAKGC